MGCYNPSEYVTCPCEFLEAHPNRADTWFKNLQVFYTGVVNYVKNHEIGESRTKSSHLFAKLAEVFRRVMKVFFAPQLQDVWSVTTNSFGCCKVRLEEFIARLESESAE